MPTSKSENTDKTPAERIMEDILPSVVGRMMVKEKDYGDTYKFLGSKGQFSDLSRKYWKLKHAIWDEQKLIGEDIDEILDDVIAHCLLLKLCQKEGI